MQSSDDPSEVEYESYHEELCTKGLVTPESLNRFLNFFVLHPRHANYGLHVFMHPLQCSSLLNEGVDQLNHEDPEFAVVVACIEAILTPVLLSLATSTESWVTICLWLGILVKVAVRCTKPGDAQARSMALGPIASATRSFAKEPNERLRVGCVEPMVHLWCAMASDDGLRGEIDRDHKGVYFLVLYTVFKMAACIHCCQNRFPQDDSLPSAKHYQDHVGSADHGSPFKKAFIQGTEKWLNRIQFATVKHLENNTADALACTSEGDQYWYAEAMSIVLTTVNYLSLIPNFRNDFPFELTVPLAMNGLAITTRKPFEVTKPSKEVSFVESPIHHLCFALNSVEPELIVTMALQGRLLQSIAQMAPLLQWASKQKDEKNEPRRLVSLVEKLLRRCIAPAMLFNSPLRAARKVVKTLDAPVPNQMGFVGATWSDLLESIRVYSSIRRRMYIKCHNTECDETTRTKILKACSRCQIALYCSQRCQRYHWDYESHQAECKRVNLSELNGRSIVSAFDTALQRKICFAHLQTVTFEALLKVYDTTHNGSAAVQCLFKHTNTVSIVVYPLESYTYIPEYPSREQWLAGGVAGDDVRVHVKIEVADQVHHSLHLIPRGTVLAWTQP